MLYIVFKLIIIFNELIINLSLIVIIYHLKIKVIVNKIILFL
jgi:hypothetical protein